jgi:hypothetical protein
MLEVIIGGFFIAIGTSLCLLSHGKDVGVILAIIGAVIVAFEAADQYIVKFYYVFGL